MKVHPAKVGAFYKTWTRLTLDLECLDVILNYVKS